MKDSRLVILSALGVKFFDFEALKKTKIQLILVLDEREKDLLPTEILHHFAAIHLLPASQETDVTIVFDYEAAKKLIQALLQTAPAAHWQLVSLSEVNLISVAKLNTYFGFPTPSPETLELYRDKCKMKDHLHKQGIRVPHHCVIDQETARQNPTAYFQKLVHEVGLPMIIKPSDSAGSFNVEKIHGEKEFLAWLPTIENDNFTYEAEEFVNGVLYHCDTAIENGEVIFSECCEYSCPNLEFKKN
jgi:biotin carboxylase